MKLLSASLLTLSLGTAAMAQEITSTTVPLRRASALSAADVQAVSPALARYAQEDVVDGLWERTQLSRRDRSLVTVAILVARDQTADLAHYLNVALDNGVTPAVNRRGIRPLFLG